MDVDKLRKINNLCMEIRKHNKNIGTDEAFRQAEAIVKEESVHTIITSPGEAPKTINSFDNEYTIQLERQNRRLTEELENLRTQVSSLKQQVVEVKRSAPIMIQQPVEQAQGEQQAMLKTQTQEPHPRQGNWKPSDVSIEKIFYFGNK